METQNNQQVLDVDQARFPIHLRNSTKADNVHAYVTGTDLQRGTLFFLCADGKTPYYPENPSSPETPLAHDCAIKLGKPGSTTPVTIPHLDSARVYFVVGKLHFTLNPGDSGPALVQPSPTDSENRDVNWGFAEFTWDLERLYANISFVDFVGLPVALALKIASGGTQHVSGLPTDGAATVCKKLEHVSSDHGDWAKLVMKSKQGDYLRAISPNNGMVLHPKLFDGYYEKYVDNVWQKYQDTVLLVNTPGHGKLRGHVRNRELNVDGESFTKPSTSDIFSCDGGPFMFAPSAPAERKAIVPCLCAGFNRSTLLDNHETPDPNGRQDYYKHAVTNHYSKIVHEVTSDGRGYAFPYDDVRPDGANDQSGSVVSHHPELLTITVGGH